MKGRYLLTFSYIGTQFKASAKISKDANTTTVIGALEWALQQFQDKLQIRKVSPITISSRTDAGVHAIENTAHVDIDHYDKFRTEFLIQVLNKVYSVNELPLRISNVRQVSNDFNARRFVMQRTYLYRLGVAKSDTVRIEQPVPISEAQRCDFFGSPCFDADAFQRALAIFPGTHDFTSFTSRPKATLAVRTPIRHIISCYARQGKPLMNGYEPFSDNYEYWDVIVEGRSFVYNQIRRMVSAAITVAIGRHSLADLERMLHSPNTDNLHNTLRYRIVPAHGLYLLKVAYNEDDLSVNRKKRVPKVEHLKLINVLNQLKCSAGS